VRNRKALDLPTSKEHHGPWVLRTSKGDSGPSFDKTGEFAQALKVALTEASDIEQLFAVWEQNVDTVRALNRSLKDGNQAGLAQSLVAHLKQCMITLAKTSNGNEALTSHSVQSRVHVRPGPKIDKSVLTLSEPKRLRSKEHLRFIARQPCLICGRAPSQAHHIRYAQPKGLSLKVSDEFTVPVCAIHHTEIHHTGDERQWWQERKIDPLSVARSLWGESSGFSGESQQTGADPRNKSV
jgi:hypothetical protein